MNSITDLSPGQLRKAADIKERIDALQNQISELLGSESSTPAALEAPEAPGNGRRKKRKKVSAKGRARMAAAQKARWAAKRGEAKPVPTVEKPAEAPKKKKRKMTAAWRIALERAWAARRAMTKAAKKAKL